MPTLKRNAPGQKIIDDTMADLTDRGLSLGPDEEALLTAAADAADDVQMMRRKVREDGLMTVNDKSGAVKAHPLLPIIATRAAQLDRLLTRLGKAIADPVAEQTPVGMAKSGARQRAGQASARSRA